MVAVPLEQSQLLEHQNWALLSMEQRLAGSIWSTQLGTHRPVDPGHFQFRCTAIGPAGLNRVRVFVGRFVPEGWPRQLELRRSLTKSSASPCPCFCSPAAA